MGDLGWLAFLQRNGLRVGLGLEVLPAVTPAVFLRHRLPVFGLAVPCLEIDASVNLPALQAADGVTHIDTIGRRRRSGPVIGRVIGCVSREGVQARDAVERYIPACGEDLLVGVGRTPARQRMLDRVLPCLVLVVIELRIEILAVQYLRRVLAFIDDGVHRGLEGELHVLGEVVFDIHVTVPGEVLAVGQVHRIKRGACQVAHLHMAERTVHVRIEAP